MDVKGNEGMKGHERTSRDIKGMKDNEANSSDRQGNEGKLAEM